MADEDSVLLAPSDLAPFGMQAGAKTTAMIADSLAMAKRVAPCLKTDEFLADADKVAAAKAILRGAVLRWSDSGSGALTQQGAGPFSQTIDTRQTRRAMFWPSEITELQELCKADDDQGNKAFALDTVPLCGVHDETCSVYFGGSCSCGVDIAGVPIFGVVD